VVFALFAWWAVRRRPAWWFLAPLAYLVAKSSATLLQMGLALFGDLGSPGGFFFQSLRNGLPGLVVLAAVNFALIRYYPKPRAGAAR
jgi:hypothetical protein